MGFFDKIKNILFEDDENDTIPVFSKEDVEATEEVVEEKKEEFEPINTEGATRFKNVKRDIDFSFDEEELFEEVKSNTEEIKIPEEPEVKKEEPVVEQPKVAEVQPEPKKDVFIAFDEAEFERLNSKISHNEEIARTQLRRDTYRDYKKPEEDAMAIARRANNNFSSTTPTVNPKDGRRDIDRYKITTKKEEKKPFTPSPVISPVYGILDKNYTKDSIVDKKGGMKRERIKPVKTEVVLASQMENKESVVEEVVKEPVVKKAEPRKDINIDLVRKKAFGAIEENYSLYDEEPVAPKSNKVLTTVGEQEDLIEFEEKYGDDIVDEAMMSVSKYNNTQDVSIEMPEEEDINIEDRVEEDLNKSKIHEYDNSIKEVKTSVEEDSKSKIMDDLEKTSTLQILDDIEKELSSIKPISKSYQDEDEEVEEVDDSRTDKVSDDTLEQDLFSLIDSMYEQGEEEEDE